MTTRYTHPNAPRTWVDQVVVDRLVAGKPPGPRRPTKAERETAARLLLAYGVNRNQISRRIGLNRDCTAALLDRIAEQDRCRRLHLRHTA